MEKKEEEKPKSSESRDLRSYEEGLELGRPLNQSYLMPSKILPKHFNYEVKKKEHKLRASILQSMTNRSIHYYTNPESNKLFFMIPENSEENSGRSYWRVPM
jgi:hypothetical protein